MSVSRKMLPFLLVQARLCASTEENEHESKGHLFNCSTRTNKFKCLITLIRWLGLSLSSECNSFSWSSDYFISYEYFTLYQVNYALAIILKLCLFSYFLRCYNLNYYFLTSKICSKVCTYNGGYRTSISYISINIFAIYVTHCSTQMLELISNRMMLPTLRL